MKAFEICEYLNRRVSNRSHSEEILFAKAKKRAAKLDFFNRIKKDKHHFDHINVTLISTAHITR